MYKGGSNAGLKFASSKNVGYVTMTMTTSGTYVGQIKASKITFKQAKKSDDCSISYTITYTDATTTTGTQALTATATDYDISLTSSKTIQTIDIRSTAKKNRFYLQAITITAAGGAVSHTLSSAVSPAAGGSVSLGATSVAEGSTTTATATPNSGYVFSSWSISGTGASLSSTTDNPTTVTMGTANATVTGTFVASCANSVTIQPANGTGTNCTFTVSPNGAQASCDGVTATVTITPTAGYGTPVVTQSGASAAPSISGGGSNSQTVTYAANTTGTSTISVVCSANNYTITLDKDLTPTTAGTASITATYNSNSNLTSAITKPTKTGWTFAGYFTAKNGGGTQIIDASGNVIASVSGYTDASRNWKHAGNITLYAKWTCTVTWSVNGLTNVYSTQTVTYNSSGSKVASVPTPDPASYCGDIFAGWSRKNAGAESKTTSYYDDLFKTVGDSPDIKNIGDITFYAVFANEE